MNGAQDTPEMRSVVEAKGEAGTFVVDIHFKLMDEEGTGSKLMDEEGTGINLWMRKGPGVSTGLAKAFLFHQENLCQKGKNQCKKGKWVEGGGLYSKACMDGAEDSTRANQARINAKGTLWSEISDLHLHPSLNRGGRWGSQMISQPVSSISLCSPLPPGTWRTPGLSIP